MDSTAMVIFLLVVSTLPQFVEPQATVVPPVASFSAILEIASGESRIFSGEDVKLKCSVPDTRSTWSYQWFKGTEQLSHQGEILQLWKAHIKQSGKYYCQGVRDTVVGNIYTRQSLPVEISVEGGWALLQVPRRPALVGRSMNFTCRVRGLTQSREVTLYRDGVEVMREKGLNPHLYLTDVTLEDQGVYSCRITWDAERRTHSIISSDVPVKVLEVLSKPVLEIDANNDLISNSMMKLICHNQYNAPAPAPPIHYYFYKNDHLVGPATSEDNYLVRQTPGEYSCKVKVPELGLSRLSEPKSFAQGPQRMVPPIFPSDPRPLAPPISPPLILLPPAAEPTAAQPSPPRSTATSAFIQPTKVSIRSSGSLLKTSQPVPSTLPTTVQPLIRAAVPETVNISDESGDMSGESGDMSGESGDMPEESGDMSLDSLDTVPY